MSEDAASDREAQDLNFEFEELEARIVPSVVTSCGGCTGCGGPGCVPCAAVGL